MRASDAAIGSRQELSVDDARRLIILDDDADTGRAIRDVAESDGVQARFVTHAHEFFRAVDEWSPTHIAVDLVMPEMDGVEVLGKLAVIKSQARVIITSGLDGRVLAAAGRAANERGLNIAGVLSKPFSPRALRELLVERPVAHRRERQQIAVGALDPADPVFDVTDRELRRAYAEHELYLVYQPQVECASGRLTGFEALVRWMHPREGVVMPDQFIGFAETHNLIDELTHQVLEQATAWIVNAFPGSNLTVAVNLSPRSAAMHCDALAPMGAAVPLVKQINTLCHVHGLDPSHLVIELTETSAIKDAVTSLDFLTRLRMNGVQLSIDDFGTGFSSMGQLVRLPFSEIKVDRSFVSMATRSPESRVAVESIIDLGHSLELRVVAEGVEDPETLRYLRDVGCDLAQGYFIGRPMPGPAAAEWAVREGARLMPGATQGSFL